MIEFISLNTLTFSWFVLRKSGCEQANRVWRTGTGVYHTGVKIEIIFSLLYFLATTSGWNLVSRNVRRLMYGYKNSLYNKKIDFKCNTSWENLKNFLVEWNFLRRYIFIKKKNLIQKLSKDFWKFELGGYFNEWFYFYYCSQFEFLNIYQQKIFVITDKRDTRSHQWKKDFFFLVCVHHFTFHWPPPLYLFL